MGGGSPHHSILEMSLWADEPGARHPRVSVFCLPQSEAGQCCVTLGKSLHLSETPFTSESDSPHTHLSRSNTWQTVIGQEIEF